MRFTAPLAALALLTVPLFAWAQSGPLPGAFDEAVSQGRPVAAQTFILGAINREPGQTQAIMADAFARAPQYTDFFSQTVAGAFPAFRGQVEAARSGAGFAASVPAAPVPASNGSGARSVVEANPVRSKVETPDEDDAFPPGDGWSGQIEAGGSITTGNTETEEANLSLSLTYDGSRWHHEIGARFNYSRDTGQVSGQRFVFDYEPRYDFTQRFYGFGFFEYRNDRFSGFDYELTESLGVGYKVLDDDGFSWLVQAGPALRLSEPRGAGNLTSEFGVLAQSDFAWQISEGASFSNETTLVYARGRTTLTNVAALTMQIIGSLQGRLAFEVRNDSDPTAGTEATDTATRATLVYGF